MEISHSKSIWLKFVKRFFLGHFCVKQITVYVAKEDNVCNHKFYYFVEYKRNNYYFKSCFYQHKCFLNWTWWIETSFYHYFIFIAIFYWTTKHSFFYIKWNEIISKCTTICKRNPQDCAKNCVTILLSLFSRILSAYKVSEWVIVV